MHQVSDAQEIADIPVPELLSSGGPGNRVHLSSCHRAAQRYVELPWWFQPSDTQMGPATHDDELIKPPTSADGSGRVLEPVEAAATTEPKMGEAVIAIAPVKATVTIKIADR
jgi:hypothetical protein